MATSNWPIIANMKVPNDQSMNEVASGNDLSQIHSVVDEDVSTSGAEAEEHSAADGAAAQQRRGPPLTTSYQRAVDRIIFLASRASSDGTSSSTHTY